MSDEDSHEPVLYRVEEGVARITLNRPHRLNALNGDMLTLLHLRLAEASDDKSVRCILLSANGKGFCAGQDLNDRNPETVDWPLDLEAIQKALFHPLLRIMRETETPVIVAVNGVAAGAGASLALAGDIVIAAESATFVQSFVKVGLSVDAGGGWQLVKAIGAARARALLLTGGAISAREAADMGLIWRCIPDRELAEATEKTARELAAGPAIAHGLIKQAVAQAEQLSFDAYLDAEARLQGIAGRRDDYREGVTAFLQKRPPDFDGR